MERQHRESARQDPYRTKTKSRDNVRCPSCKAVSLSGRWYPSERIPRGALLRETRSGGKLVETTCPACRQQHDHFAQGVVEIRGSYWQEKRDQVLRTITGTEIIARARNDQERILWTRTARGTARFYVTLPGLARRIGRELARTFKGKVTYQRTKEEPFIRVVWDSDNDSAKLPERKNRPRRSRAWRGRGAA